MGPELMLLALTSGAMLPPRERGESFVVRSSWTCDSETSLLTATLSGELLRGTGDIEVAPSVEDLVRSASRLVRALAQALPPVDHEAEAALDRLMAERRRMEPRRPLVPRI